MKRFGQMIRLKPSGAEEYVHLHAAVWPDVLKMIRKCNITNCSIYRNDNYIFSYFDYVGDNFESDMDEMAADLATQQW